MEKFSINRFLDVQERNYEQALNELRNGRKTSHWMWYIFPQLRFLGHSDTAYYYGIADEEEAKEQFMSKLREQFIDKKARKVQLEYYNDETSNYDTGIFYVPDFVFHPLFNTSTGIVYDGIRVVFISYVDNSNVE